jgi:hypothetical protein
MLSRAAALAELLRLTELRSEIATERDEVGEKAGKAAVPRNPPLPIRIFAPARIRVEITPLHL